MRSERDAVVIGGGHNGLVAARVSSPRPGCDRGARSPARRDRRRGRHREPWGPEFKVTALSYVMSLMPTDDPEGLQLARRIQGAPDGAVVHRRSPTAGLAAARRRPERNVDESPKFSKHDADLAD